MSALAGPIAGHCILAFGVLWWAWDYYMLPKLGYVFKIKEKKVYSDRWKTEILDIQYMVSQRNIGLPVCLGKTET